MFKNATLVRATGAITLAELRSNAEARQFVSCGPTQTKSLGFVPPRAAGGELIEYVAGACIFAVKTETKSVPASEVKKQLELRLDKVQEETGRRPRGKAAKEFKEEIILDLLPKAFPKEKTAVVWISPIDGLVVIDSTSASQIDDVTRLLAECLHEVQLSLVSTVVAPALAMASWLCRQEAPDGFTIDRECELKQPDSEKACVRYSRHTLDTKEVAEHIKQGKLPTRLAMTHEGNVSFVLTEGLALKKLDFMVAEIAGDGEAVDKFDADVAIETGELRRLITDLLAAMGGEQKISQ